MRTPKEIKNAVDRIASKFTADASGSRITNDVECVVQEGLLCTVTADRHQFVVDMPGGMGGEDAGPNPGAYARGALGSCLAIGYAIIFARREVPYSNIRVRVEADLDVRGGLGMDGAEPAFEELRYSVDIDSCADAVEVQKAIDEADANSPILHSFKNPIPVQRTLSINGTKS